ncbi:hypothetical protein NBH20_01280 [Rhizobium sp. S153]|uniref:Uncharacterized protein n=1 Tax=Ciceribacter sichuanensis TaxID=2949647 RepID=A0ABT0V1K0_9HYPH|nr:hypothetical protein [Ciceribacter sp. S153]MCM2399774.1 hypothetical protein [Ciceribacter sp. S153]
MIEEKQSLGAICDRYGLKTQERRRMLVLIVDYHKRLKIARDGFISIVGRSRKKPLPNSFDVPAIDGLDRKSACAWLEILFTSRK